MGCRFIGGCAHSGANRDSELRYVWRLVRPRGYYGRSCSGPRDFNDLRFVPMEGIDRDCGDSNAPFRQNEIPFCELIANSVQ